MARLTLRVNGRAHEVDVPADMPLLWTLRDILGLTGTKYGCGAAQCGACTVHLDGRAVRSCVTPSAQAAGHEITTIEGLSDRPEQPLLVAWVAEEVAQCGYCQPGQLMSAAALLAATPRPTDADIDQAMAGNLCRCGTYDRIRLAIRRASEGAASNG